MGYSDFCPHLYQMRPEVRGLSHGLKTAHRTVFAPASPGLAFRVALVRQMPEGTRLQFLPGGEKLEVSIPSSRDRASVHRTDAFDGSSPTNKTKKRLSRMKTIISASHLHPLRDASGKQGTLPRPKNSPPDCFYPGFAGGGLSSPARHNKKSRYPNGYLDFLVRRKGLEPLTY